MILLITPFFPPSVGGVETHLDDYINYLKVKKIKTYVLTYKLVKIAAKVPFKERRGSVTIYRFPYLGLNLFYRLEFYPVAQFLYLFSGLFVYSFFILLLHHRGIRIIHSHGFASGLVSGLLGKIFQKKPIISLHTIYKLSQRPQLARSAKMILNLNEHILAIAPGCKDDLIRIGITKKKITVYGYWVDTSQFKLLRQLDCQKRLNLPKDSFILLFVGRFTPEKLVKEALLVASLLPFATVLFVGQGPLEKKVKIWEKRFPNIKLVGPVENIKMPDYYNAADLLLLGSVDEDYFGKVTMEAMSSGLPVLIPNESYYFGKYAKIDPTILPSSCGFLVDLDPKSIAQKINKLSRHREKLRKMRPSCRKFALANFGPKNAEIIFQTYG